MRMNALATDVGKLQQSLESLKLTTQTLDARGDTLLSHLSSMEGVVQSIQDRLAAGPTSLEGSPRAARVEIQELVAMSESRTLQRTKSEVESLRLQLVDLRSSLNDGLDARTAATGEVERKSASLHDSLQAVRAEMNSLRGESQEASIREARLGAEVRSVMETLSVFQSELRETAAKTAGQIADSARLEQAILVLQQHQRASNFANMSNMSFSEAGSPHAPHVSFSPAKPRVEERLRRVEDVLDMLPPQLQERLRILEASSSTSEVKTSSAATAAVNAVTSSLAPTDG